MTDADTTDSDQNGDDERPEVTDEEFLQAVEALRNRYGDRGDA